MKIKKADKRKHLGFTFFYGWVIVIIAAMTLFFSGPGQTYSNGYWLSLRAATFWVCF